MPLQLPASVKAKAPSEGGIVVVVDQRQSLRVRSTVLLRPRDNAGPHRISERVALGPVVCEAEWATSEFRLVTASCSYWAAYIAKFRI